jgi:uncharacterized membrane protein YoaK (UPF0700 family)
VPVPRDLVHDAQLVALAAVGGAMDAASYLRLHVFTANMTGNAVVSGLALGGTHPLAAWNAVAAIVAFMAGVAGGTALRDVRRILVLEAFVLGAFVLFWQASGLAHAQIVLALIVSGSAAMGLQTAATRSAHGASASTTFMTGTLTRATAAALEAFRDAARASVAFLSGLTFLVYLSAAVAVGALAAHDADVLAIVPLAALVIVLIVALSPRRSPEEKS